MTKLKGLYQIIDVFVTGIWGLTIIDLIIFVDLNNFKNLDNAIKILLAAAGLFYLVFIRIPNEYKMGKLNRREKKAEAENTELENKKLKNELNK
tara:strand:+ start:733 stop:1014 length:282 start_codon:yes stop_codon:yes gene_type:complete